MWIWRVMRKVVYVLMVVTVRMGVSDRGSIRLAGAGAFPFAEGAALRQSLHVVMVLANTCSKRFFNLSK